jgi:hypothetical protein
MDDETNAVSLRTVLYCLTGAVLLFCLFPLGFGDLVKLAVYALFGWVLFLGRVLPQLTVSPNGLATGMVCFAVLSAGLHVFLRWQFAHMQRAKLATASTAPHRWRWRWTMGIILLVVLLFVSGLAATGVTHQAVWFLTSAEPNLQLGHFSYFRSNELEVTGKALAAYHDAHQHFPPGSIFNGQGEAVHSWQTALLPYLGPEQARLYDRIDQGLPWNHPKNLPAMRTSVEAYYSPDLGKEKDRAGLALSKFAGNVHVLAGDKALSKKEITDGLSHTILAGEVADGYKPWGDPTNWRDPALGLRSSPTTFGFGNVRAPGGSRVEGGCWFLFADGSVRFVKANVDPKVLRALATPSGGEKVELPE